MIYRHHNNPLAGHCRIIKTRELVMRKYFRPILCQEVKTYVKEYDIYLTSKAVYFKPYKNLSLLLVLTYYQKNLFMDFGQISQFQ